MNTLFDLILNNNNLNKIAIIEDDKKYTYSQLKNDCCILFDKLKKNYGLKKKICICLPNTYTNIILFIVASKLQYKIFPINTGVSKNNFLNYVERYKFDLFVLDNIKLKNCIKSTNTNPIISSNKILSLLKENNDKTLDFINIKKSNNISNERYLIILSSGSTGDPKPIILSQKNKYLRSKLAGKTYNFNNNEVVILPYQLDHSVGQRLMFMSLLHNGTLILTKNFDCYEWLNLCHKHSVTFSILVSFHIKNILKRKLNINKLKKLKNLVSVSDVLEDDVRKKITRYAFNFHEIYGAAEISTVTNIKHRKNSKNKSVGRILNFVKIKIINKNNKILKDGEIGEIICKTPLMFEKYYKKNILTKKSFYKNYFKTGDYGYIKKNHLYFLGRLKNLIKVSGLSVFPEDIEKTIKKLKYIKNCVVKSEYDKTLGEKVVAIIEGKKEKENDIYIFCLNNLETHQIPTKFYFTKNIKKTFLGKIDRKSV